MTDQRVIRLGQIFGSNLPSLKNLSLAVHCYPSVLPCRLAFAWTHPENFQSLNIRPCSG
jgi:hypothetical protein